MNIKQYISGAALAMLALGFAACDGKDEPVYKPAATPTEAQRVFFAEASTTENIDKEDTSFTVNLYRPENEEAGEMTVQLLVSCAEEGVLSTGDYRSIITVPTQVTFAEGMPFAPIKIEYDAAAMEDNHPYPIVITVDDAHADEYGIATTTVNVNKELFTEWALFDYDPEIGRDGHGEYNFGLFFSGSDNIQLLYREVPNNTKIKQFQVQWLIDSKKPELGYETFMEFSTDDDMKSFTVPVQPIYEHPSYGTVYFCDLYTFSGDEEDEGGSSYNAKTGTFTLNLIYFCSAGVFGDGDETIQMNGYIDTNDYTVGLSDHGQIRVNDEDLAVIGVNLTKATTFVAYTVVKGELEDEEVQAVGEAITKQVLSEGEEAEEAEGEEGEEIADEDVADYEVSIVKESGNVMLNLPSSGDYTIVAVAFKTNFDGTYEARSTDSMVFTYTTNPLAGFTLVAKEAKFETDFFAQLIEGAPAETLSVEVYQNDDTPNLYRIANPFAKSKIVEAIELPLSEFGCIDFIVLSNGQVVFPLSNIGIIDEGDEMGLMSYAYYFMAYGYSPAELPAEIFGTFKDNKLTFPASTYVDEDGIFPNFLVCYSGQPAGELNFDLNLDMTAKAAASAPALKGLKKGMAKLTNKALRSNMKKMAFPAHYSAKFNNQKASNREMISGKVPSFRNRH